MTDEIAPWEDLPSKEVFQLVRPQHPSTSVEAAEIIVSQLPELKRKVYDVLDEAGPSGLSDLRLDQRCAAKYGQRGYSSYRSRRCELADLDLVIDTGKKVTQEGTSRIVWALKKYAQKVEA